MALAIFSFLFIVPLLVSSFLFLWYNLVLHLKNINFLWGVYGDNYVVFCTLKLEALSQNVDC